MVGVDVDLRDSSDEGEQRLDGGEGLMVFGSMLEDEDRSKDEGMLKDGWVTSRDGQAGAIVRMIDLRVEVAIQRWQNSQYSGRNW